jgi:eukaryotic-like serine/threonine-protein kinase
VAKSAKDLIGTRVGKYTLRRFLGRGAFGEVYVGSPTSGPDVAIKLLDPQLARVADVVARFEREATTARRLDHPGVVRVLGVGAARERHYIVMELVHGGSFRKFLRKGGTPEQVVRILADVAHGLAYAHAQGIIHRDVKPENILLTKSRRAKVADFGLARAVDQSTMTTDGHMIGTAMYMSPEQALGHRATAASDVYAVGMMIYEAISGERPFSSDNTYGLLYQHVEAEVPRPRVRGAYPSALASLAMRCLAKTPEGRPSMNEVAALLEEATTTRVSHPMRAAALLAGVTAALFAVLVVWPALLDKACSGWFGAAWLRALRAALHALHAKLL